MVATKACALLVFMLVCFARVAAIQKANGRSQTLRHQGDVCISLVAYEDPVWINLLIRNVLRFTDCSTKVALHLNRLTNYSNEDIDNFDKSSSRVSVNPERVEVHRSRPSVLHAHVLNAIHMQKVWGKQCNHYVMQASNMLWIKLGMESYTEEFRVSGMHSRTFGECDGLCAQLGWSPKDRAWKQPEGTFVPMSLMSSFVMHYMRWFHTLPDWEYFHVAGPKEEDWLQTYSCVHEGKDPVGGPTLCERLNKDTVLGVVQVKEMVKGSLDEEYKDKYKKYYVDHEDFCERTDAKSMAPFSVKVNSGGGGCVTRDPDSEVSKWLDLTRDPFKDPVIKYIMDLTDAAPTLSEGISCHGVD